MADIKARDETTDTGMLARLSRTRVLSTRYERREPSLLLGLAGLHLAWALVRVFSG